MSQESASETAGRTVSALSPSTGWLGEQEERVAIAGDWHSNRAHILRVLTDLREHAPDVHCVLQLGDFSIWPDKGGKAFLRWIDRTCADLDIRHILVTPGNHEDHGRLDRRFASRPGEAVRISDSVWALPRGHRMILAGRTVLSFGGAVSMDREYRREGRDWWPGEAATDEDVDYAVAGGNVDVMLAHDAILRGTRQVASLIDATSSRWGRETVNDSEFHRNLVTQVWEATHAKVFFHGHFHVQGEVEAPDQRWVYSLAADGMRGNTGILNLTDLSWTWLP